MRYNLFMFNLSKKLMYLLAVNIIGILGFSYLFIAKENYEFMIYIAVIIFFLMVILFSNKKVNYPVGLLWGLTAWSYLHMAGGSLYWHGTKFYELMLWPIVGEPYNIFRYDQFVHMVGFWVATLLAYHLLTPFVKEGVEKKISFAIVVVMAGLGFGALNEIVEFAATVIVPETGVGGYVNTALDLVFDFVGAIGAMVYIRIKNNPKIGA